MLSTSTLYRQNRSGGIFRLIGREMNIRALVRTPYSIIIQVQYHMRNDFETRGEEV